MLQHEGACTMSELSRKVMLDPSTLVPTIDNLERRKFIIKERDPNDRRRLPLSLTEQGLATIESIPLLDDDHPIIHSLDKLGEEPAEQLVELLRNLVMNLPDGEHLLEQAQSRMKPIFAKEEDTHASN